MSPKNLANILLIVFPIFALFIIFVSLYFFSNFKVSTNFVYFEQSQYSSQNAISVVDNKITFGESEAFKIQKQFIMDQKKQLEECKLGNSSLANNQDCERKLGGGQEIINQNNNIPLKIYLYDSEKETSKLIDLETAKKLNLVPERKNELGESFEDMNCGSSGLFFGGYSGPCNGGAKITIKKNYNSKIVDLETSINLEPGKYGISNGQNQRTIYWVKK